MAHLAIWLLGPFRAEVDGKILSGFRSDKVRALLSYLAVESHRPWGRRTLAGLLWPDFPEQAALSNLRNAISNLRRVIGDLSADPPFLQVSPATIQFDSSGDSSVDVKTFLDLNPKTYAAAADPADTSQLSEALALYRGEFMEGFTVDSAPFEEWILSTRERIRGTLLHVVRLLAISKERSGELAAALDYIQRWIDLEPWAEDAYRHQMQILALEGQRNAALALYDALCSRLAQDLGIAPEIETVQLYDRIRAGKPEALLHVNSRISGLQKVLFPGPLPAFVTNASTAEAEPKLFVARQKELGHLERGLEKIIQSEGQICFVTGEPGSGKTTLLSEFSNQVIQKYPEVLILWGQCNAYTGEGDPYFPFLNITRMLAGEVESLLTGGVITLKHIQRLWEFLPETLTTLLDYGPDLLNRFLKGGEGLHLAQVHPGLIPEMWERVNLQLQDNLQGSSRPSLQQVALFEQFAQVVTALSRLHPLVIILDDLQWIDSGSVNLLFHLGRHLKGSKVLLLGAYRTEEITQGRDGGPHPLEGVLQELGAIYGDIIIDLTQSEGLEFVEALLDSEPNELSPEFCRMLFQRTAGHPLFTIELLRGMQLRREIIRNDEGRWVEASRLNWEQLPARVEAVIARRIHLLSQECQVLLNAASVEGEKFSAEVIAHVLGIDEERVFERLSQEIAKRHRLVTAQGLKQIAGQQLSVYQFRHSLFQIYLYNHLDVLERSRLHGKIGDFWQEIYQQDQERLQEFAHALARHFEAAGMAYEAVRYYTMAGKNALRLSASQEALTHFYRALRLLKTLPPTMERNQQELELQLNLGPPLTAIKGWAPPEMTVAYERAQELCQNISDHALLIPALWLLAVYRLGRSEHAEVDRLSERLARLAKQQEDPGLHSLANLQVSPFYQGRFDQAKGLLEGASIFLNLDRQRTLAQQYGMAPSVVGLAYLAECLWFLGFPDQADQCSLQARELAEEIKHPMTSCYAISRSCWLNASKGDREALRDRSEKLYRITKRYGFKNFEFAAIFFVNWADGMGGLSAGKWIDTMRRMIENYYMTGTILNRTAFLVLFGQACSKAGQVERGLQAITESIELAEKTGELWYQAEAFRVKGEMLLHLGTNLHEAETSLLIARQIACQQGAKMPELRAASGIWKLRQQQGRHQEGREILTQVYNTFAEGFNTSDLQGAKALLDH